MLHCRLASVRAVHISYAIGGNVVSGVMRRLLRSCSSAFHHPILLPAVSSSKRPTGTSHTNANGSPLQRRCMGYLSTKKVPDASPSPPATAARTSPYGVKKASPSSTSNEYDLIILGGGSGGLAFSKEASAFGQKVALLDFVEKTPHGSQWGLGGTCVNVGCIPKKLMHQAAMIGEDIAAAHRFGWGVSNSSQVASSDQPTPRPIHAKHHWPTLVDAVQQYIRSLNFGYRARVTKDTNITYINARGSLTGPRTVIATDAKGVTRTLTARKHIVIAVGGRPRYPSIPGAEHGITSDDIFSLRTPPGKTLVVGAGYIALESAGFLTGLGFETTVMARSRYLRGFDQDISNMIVDYMKRHGTKFSEKQIPTRVERLRDGKLKVWSKSTDPAASSSEETSDVYDTVLWAIGRDPRTPGLGLETVGVKTEKHGGQPGKMILRDSDASHSFKGEGDPDESSVPGIYALGDVAKQRPELTPVAIGSAKLLARRLYAPKRTQEGPHEAKGMSLMLDYAATPTTVFTPLEYGCVGLSEEESLKRYGAERVDVYHSHFKPLAWALPEREENACYVKIVVKQPDRIETLSKHELSQQQRVLGLHFLGPNAGEVMQGFAVAFAKGLTREDLDLAIGIHPTAAEELLSAEITKSSGEDPQKTGC